MNRTSILLTTLLILYSMFSIAQEASFRSKPIKAHFSTDHSSIITIISPEEFANEGNSRGFKRVKKVKEEIVLVGTVTDQDGIRLVLINDQSITLMDQGYFRHVIPVVEGMTEVVIQVLDNKNNSVKKTLDIEVQEPIGTGDYYALLIGVDQYLDPEIVDLEKPIQDSRTLGKILNEQYTFADENINYLENPTRGQIIDALDQLSVKLTEEDNLLIFYAGHGYWDSDKETGYWIPADGLKSSTANWVRNTTLTDQLRTIKTKHTLLIADACFSGSIYKSRSVFIEEEAVAVKKLYSYPSRKAITSGALSEVPDNSEFLKFLSKRLETNDKKYLSSGELFSSIRMAVINNSDIIPQYGTIQKAGDEGGDFIFIRK
jgi:hypothetical protein